ESMTAEPMHVTKRAGEASVAHQHRYLVQCFGQQCPKIPIGLRAAHIGARVAFDSVVEVREFERVTHKKHWRIVADHVPVAFLGVKLQCEAPNIALCISSAALTRNRRKARKQFCFLAYFRKQLRLGVLGDIVSYSKGSICT